MGMSSGPSGGAMADINVTPLVDVMLVLLIIFMVTTPMMNTAGVPVDLPRAEAPPMTPNPDKEQLVLSINKDLQVFVGELQVPSAEVGAKLSALAEANPTQEVFVRADGDVPYREVAALLGLAKRAGMPRVGLVFEPGVSELSQPKGR